MSDNPHISDLPEQIERFVLAKLSPLERVRFVTTSKEYANKYSFFLHSCPNTPVYDIPSQEVWETFLQNTLETALYLKPNSNVVSVILGVCCIMYRYIENTWIPYMYWLENELIDNEIFKVWYDHSLEHFPLSHDILQHWKGYVTKFIQPVQEMYQDLCTIMNEKPMAQNYEMEFHLRGMNGEINANDYSIEYTGMNFDTPFVCEFRAQNIPGITTIFSVAEDVETVWIHSNLTNSQKIQLLLWIRKYSSLKDWIHMSSYVTSIPSDPMSTHFPEIKCQPRWTSNGTNLSFHI